MARTNLSAALFGKTRRAVLALFFAHPDRAFYVREIVRAMGVGQGAVQRELRRLSDAEILTRSGRGSQVYYRANAGCPIFGELRGIAVKTAGLADVLRGALEPLAPRIAVAFIHGSIAGACERAESDVDVLLVGDATFAEVAEALGAAQETVGREVNPTVYPVHEFQRKLAAGHHFLKTVMKGPKVFLIGDARDLERLAG
jgi:DNA-binding transcriptional ArsR family regulator